MIGTFGPFTCLVVPNSRVQDDKRRIVHLLFFVATNFSAFHPIIHTETIFP
ncbi:unnamed protein product, partial [Clonostachys rosea f. rosea IK726]